MPEQLNQTGPISALNDRDLLRRFYQDADEVAFAEIVRRHQGLVMGVCRRVIGHGNQADLDDAFQATFITLARRPRKIQKAASLSSWLYTVAWRTSWRLVKKRRKHPVEPLVQHPTVHPVDPLDRIATEQDCLVLDQELNQLPGRYREVLVMTYFADQTSQEIADQLSVSKGTVDGRIRQARNLLRVRLARRGVAIGALAAAASLSSNMSAAASPALIESTIQLGAQTLSGSVPGTTDLSHLETFIRPETAMFSSKILVTGLLCSTAVVGILGMNGHVFGQGDEAGNAQPQIETVVEGESADQEKSVDVPVVIKGLTVSVDPNAIASATDAGVAGSGGGAGGGKSTARFKHYPSDARPVERWLYEMLDEPIPALDFPGETPLSEVLELISSHYTTTYGADGAANKSDFRFTVYPDKAELDLEGVNTLEDVTISDINLEGIELRSALKLIFEQTTEPELTYEIKNEVMYITTKSKAESDESLVTRVYEVSNLVNMDFNTTPFTGGGFFSVPATQLGTPGQPNATGKIKEQGVHPLVTIVAEMTSPPCRWIADEGEGGAIRLIDSSLVVRQTQQGHREVVRLLNLLSESIIQSQSE